LIDNTYFYLIILVLQFPREVRKHVEFSGHTASEVRTFNQFLFIIIAEHFENSHQPELAALWARFGFVVRAVMQPNEEFLCISKAEVKRVLEQFYRSYTKELGEKNCRPNIHTVSTVIIFIGRYFLIETQIQSIIYFT
jgi:hypothetical protein